MAFTRERNGRHIALYRDSDGKQKSAGTFATKREAVRAARVAEAHGFSDEKTVEVYTDKVRGKVTVAGYAAQWLPGHSITPAAREVYDRALRIHILPALGMRAIADIKASDIKSFFRSLEDRGTSHAMLAKVKTVASALMQSAAEDGLTPVNVVRGVRFQADPPARRRALTAAELKRVRKYMAGEDRLFFDIVMATGARIEEIRGMMAEDVTHGVWTIQRVRSQVGPEFVDRKSTKTGKARSVTLPADLAARIEAAGPGRIFTDVTRQVFRIRWAMACKAAGLDWTPAPRDLRRTFATLARTGGADLESVQHALGHSKLWTTSIYLAERPEVRDDAFLAVQKALRGAA